MSNLFNPEEAGKRLRISESTVYRFFRAHKLKGVKVDGALRFTEEDLLAFIERHREQVEPEQQQASVISLSHTPKISFS
jgi:excisionase family DNA binding protein